VSSPQFIASDLARDRAELIELNIEYASWVFGEIASMFGIGADDIVGMSVRDYIPTVIDKVCGDTPPEGSFYLVRIGGELAGMGGLRRLDAARAEIKRVYFRPAFRGRKLGQLMLARLLADARSFGYAAVCLDTAPFMHAAHRLYEANGFFDRPPYDGVEVPSQFHAQWRFMERRLDDGAGQAK